MFQKVSLKVAARARCSHCDIRGATAISDLSSLHCSLFANSSGWARWRAAAKMVAEAPRVSQNSFLAPSGFHLSSAIQACSAPSEQWPLHHSAAMSVKVDRFVALHQQSSHLQTPALQMQLQRRFIQNFSCRNIPSESWWFCRIAAGLEAQL